MYAKDYAAMHLEKASRALSEAELRMQDARRALREVDYTLVDDQDVVKLHQEVHSLHTRLSNLIEKQDRMAVFLFEARGKAKR